MSIQKISIIAAIDENNGIGLNNYLPWPKIKEDFQRFRTLTTNKIIVMGRKTWESLPIKPLPNRINFILTRDNLYIAPGANVVNSIDSLLNLCKSYTEIDEIFVIGGSEIYNQFLPIANIIYLTKIHNLYDTDTKFPKLNLNELKLIGEEKLLTVNGIELSFLTYEKLIVYGK